MAKLLNFKHFWDYIFSRENCWVVATQRFFFIFTRNPGEMIQFDEHIFQLGWFNHQLGRENKVQSCISGSIG